MNTACFDSEFASEPVSEPSQIKAILVESFLVAATAAFWLVALPFVAVSLVCVKVWDAIIPKKSGSLVRPTLNVLEYELHSRPRTIESRRWPAHAWLVGAGPTHPEKQGAVPAVAQLQTRRLELTHRQAA